jgi:hypothetical protein
MHGPMNIKYNESFGTAWFKMLDGYNICIQKNDRERQKCVI